MGQRVSRIRVLIVEDEPMAADVHAEYTRRLEQFEVVGVVGSAREAHRFLSADHDVELVLLDLSLPDGHGLGLLQRLRSEGATCEVIAVTAARDVMVVRRAIALGVSLYLLKPFDFQTFRTKLLAYAEYRNRAAQSPVEVAQHEVDQMLGSLHGPGSGNPHPKGISVETLDLVTGILREWPGGVSASAVAQGIGVSRVTARRYLEHLTLLGAADRSPRYLPSGRPEMHYRWRRTGPGPS